MKGKKKAQTPNSDTTQKYNPPKKEISFEDLLKEFTEGGSEKPAEDYEDLREPVVQKTTVAKEWGGSDEEATSVYEQSIQDARKVDMADSGHDHHLQRFAVFEEEEEDTFLQDLNEDLQKEDGLKRAIIYKEILDRKHF